MTECLITRRGREVSSTSLPEFTYTGNYSFIDDGEKNWRIKFLTSGVLTFTKLGNAKNGIDVFCVGGGGANSYSVGGCGGSTKTQKSVAVSAGTNYPITIGAGAQGGNNQSLQGGSGGDTTAFGVTGGRGQICWRHGFWRRRRWLYQQQRRIFPCWQRRFQWWQWRRPTWGQDGAGNDNP